MATPQRVCAFEPSVWNDFFIQYEPQPTPGTDVWMSEECTRVKMDELKEDVHNLFGTLKDSDVEKMTLVETLQRLGIDHLFQEQIDTVMKEIHESKSNSGSLYEIALRFRLLREHGLWVSQDVFDQFRGKDGSFDKDIFAIEQRGVLSFYNAAYLAVHGESELDEAISFAREHLEFIKGVLKYPLSEQVKRNLEIPYPRTLKRIDAPYYIREYKHEQGCNPSVLELTRLDFNHLQRLHKQELKAFCRWGKDLYEEVGLSYSRDRIVECYFWSYTVYYEEHYGHARIILAKLFVLSSLLDDTFDMHATLEEGRKLNEAIQRWDDNAIPLLPEYLKKYYIKCMSTFREFEDELEQDFKYRVLYCRQAFQTLCKHYQQESDWFHSSYIPSFEDHVKCSVMSAGTPSLIIGSLVGMGDEATDEAFEWAMGYPDVVKACGEVTRFMDDLAAFKHGKNKLDVASSLDSYINEHHVTSEEAIAVLNNLVEDAWKTTNQARFGSRVLIPIVNHVANLAKSMTLLFHDKSDLYTFSRGNRDRIHQHFVEPIPL